ncbi:hypothetical protein [Caudoviricetes sp.]|nr:hypothetical protein [Caudoviricetes sp.]
MPVSGNNLFYTNIIPYTKILVKEFSYFNFL